MSFHAAEIHKHMSTLLGLATASQGYLILVEMFTK